MAFHPGEYRIASAISSLKTQKASQWHYLNLPFGLFYSYYKLFEMTSCYAICSQSSLKSLTKPKPHSKSQESTLQESSSFFFFLFLFTDKLRNPNSRLDSQMDFVNVLKFSAACFDLLAWPLFALGYPLCASIWVIETNSISDVRKLVTYWVLFSLISLFDNTFSELLEWIPFWPYIKLMIICWLVIPHFDGSHYVYQNLVHPCLSIDTQVVMNRRFNESKMLFHSRENFLVVADRYIKENGAEALAKLLARKPNVEVKEIKAPAAPEQKVEQVKQTETNLGETKSNTTCIVEIKERTTALMTAEIEACRDDRTPEISLHKKIQKEWACAVCQVTTQSEVTLNSHLQGKRHQATSEQLKAKNQATKGNGSPSASVAKISDQSTKEEQPECTSNNLNSKNNGISAASTVKKPDETKDDERQKCASSNGLNQKNNKEWACALCQFTTQSDATLNSHLQGKRHQAISEQLKAKNQATKINGTPSASMARISDQSTKEEQPKCTSNNLNCKNNGISAASTVKKPDETKDDKRQKCASSNGPNQKNKKVWACALCQVTTQSEATLNSHLQGKRHQATSEQQLKAKNQATKTNGSPSASMAKKSDGSTKEEQPKCTSNNLNSKNNGIPAASTVKKPDKTKDDERQKCASSNGSNQKNKKVWSCALCQVTTQSEATLNSHLQGKRHQATSEQLKAKNQAIKTNGSPSASMAKKSDGSTKEEQPKCTSNNQNSKNNGISAASTVKKPDKTKDDEQQKCASSNGPNQKNNKKWACALCQVTTQSEATLNSHLQGKRHQATSELLKGKNKATKASGSSSASMAKKSDQSTKEEQLKCTSNNLNSKNNGISAASKVKKPDDTKDDERQKCASSNGRNQKNNKKQEKALVPETNEQGHQKNLKQTGDGMKELGSWCNICNVSCTSKLDMASHLNGRRHFDSIKQLSELWCSNCNVKCNSEVDMASHQNGRRHLEQLKERLGLWCSICCVSCNSKVDMDSHLNGRRHLDQIEEQLRFWCGACNLMCNSELKMASHLNRRSHLKTMRNI